MRGDITGRTLIIVAVIISAISYWGCTSDDELKPLEGEADSTASGKIRPDNEIIDARMAIYDGSIKTADIQADYIEKYTKQDSTPAWGLEVQFFDRRGAKTSHMVADSGLVRESIKMMVANGNVVVVTEDGSRLETEQLFWHGKDEKITTDEFVTIYQKGDTLMGYGLETDPKLTRLKIKRQVRGTLQDADELTE